MSSAMTFAAEFRVLLWQATTSFLAKFLPDRPGNEIASQDGGGHQ
jgi:hypothetical protein